MWGKLTLSQTTQKSCRRRSLLQHFRSYLENSEKPESSAENEEEKKMDDPPPERNLESIVYVKKWMRTRHAIMFRLSNKIVQVNF